MSEIDEEDRDAGGSRGFFNKGCPDFDGSREDEAFALVEKDFIGFDRVGEGAGASSSPRRFSRKSASSASVYQSSGRGEDDNV